jgi:ribosome-associated toxin RatA of RatAB toxin-antitoxin module
MNKPEEQEFTTEVNASVQQCFATIVDFDQYPRWFSTVESTKVRERYPNGLAKRVALRVDMKLKTIGYVLEYEYDKPGGLSWKAVEGDLDFIEGAYEFEKLSPRRSRVTCRQAVAIGFWVPGPLRTLIERQALKQSVLEFKAAVEKAAKAPAPSRRTKK